MHIVFIVGSYYPNYSAVGKCAGNVADQLSKAHKVTVICQKNTCEQADKEAHNNQNIIRIITKDKQRRDSLNKKIAASKGIKSKLYKSVLKLYKLSRGLKVILSEMTIQKYAVDEYINALRSIKEPIAAVISASMPFEAVIAAVKYKTMFNPSIKVIPYLFDQFADSDTLHRTALNKKLKMKRHIALEKETLQAAEFVLAMHSLKAHFERALPELKNIKYMEHPLLINNSRSSEQINNTGIKIAYIGGLYKNYVIPDYLLELFAKSSITEAVLHFYIIGNCSETVDSYCSKQPSKIINHGSVDKQTASSETANSNILISIAEIKGIQMSSKIFEYMSYGKPIIHFYTADNDVNLKILKKYPLALCLKQDTELMKQNLISFDAFCREHQASRIPYEMVEKLFMDASPKYTANLIEEAIT